MKVWLLILFSAGLLVSCDTYNEDYRRAHRRQAVYREDYYREPYDYGYASRRAYYRSYPEYPERAYVRPYYRSYGGPYYSPWY